MKQMYGEILGSTLYLNMKFDLNLLFDDYLSTYGSSSASESGVGTQSSQTISELQLHQSTNTMSLMKERFKKHKFDSGLGRSK